MLPDPRPRQAPADSVGSLAPAEAGGQASRGASIAAHPPAPPKRWEEEHYKVLFETSRDALMTLAPPSWRFTSGNPAAIQMFRARDAADFIARAPWEYSPETQSDGRPSMVAAQTMIGTAMREGSHFFEWTHRRLNGEDFPATVLLTRVELGGVVMLQATVRDITAQKEAEQALRRSEERYRALVETTFDLVWEVNADNLYTYVSPKCRVLLGYAPEEMLGRQPLDFMPSEEAARVSALFADITATRRPFAMIENVNRHRDGHLVVLESSGVPIFGPCGEFAGYRGSDRDITDSRRAQEQLRKLSLAVEQSPESIVITDLDGNIEYVNAAFVSTTGYSRKEAIGQNPRILRTDKTPKETHEGLWTHLTSGQSWKGRFVNRRKDGSEYVEFARITPIREPNGRITHYVAVKEDITEKTRLAEELDRYRHHLEDLVAERTAELSAARSAAEAASLAKSTFLANMSHEIRTPMNAIMGLAHLMERDSPDPSQRDRLSKITQASNHLLRIINDILDISKIEAGKASLEVSELELDDLMHKAAELVADKARAKGLEVVVDCDPVCERVRGDQTRLVQALLNYVSNAVKFTDRGSIVLRARAIEVTELELLVRFEVEDTGSGIPEDVQPRLFQAFEQADSSITRRHGGTGLGLAITRRLAQMMQGDAGFETNAGKGSCFWFTARLAVDVSRAAPRAEPLPAGTRVLVVDDLPAARLAMGRLLEALGAEVDLAESWEAALRAAKGADEAGRSYSLVLLDSSLPDSDNRDPLYRIKTLSAGPQPPCLRLAASEAEEGNCDATLMKPVKAAVLGGRLRKLLCGRTAPDSSPAAGTAARQILRQYHQGARVLLAEDNAVNQEVALELLRGVGLAVDLAGDGAQAVAMVQRSAYDLILMDVQMPVMDGLAATRAIRALPGRQGLPIIAMTANALGDDRRRCLDAGMNDHLGKPVDPEALYAALLSWIPKTSLSDSPAEESSARARLAGISGLDLETGLRSLDGQLAAYERLLRQYVTTHGQEMQLLREHLAAGALEEARRIAHALKGVAGALGAFRVQQLAASLDAAIRGQAPPADITRLGAALEVEQTQLTTALLAVLGAPPEPPQETMDWPRLRETLARLESLLAEDDIEANRTFRESASLLRGALGEQTRELEQAISGFDYERAGEILRALRSARLELG